MTHKERFENIGNRPPKGLLMHGPPGTGKTLMARACAAQTKATFLKLAGPQLVQMFIGDGAKMVRVDDTTACADPATAGSPNVFAEGKAVHRQGDATGGHDSWVANRAETGSGDVIANG